MNLEWAIRDRRRNRPRRHGGRLSGPRTASTIDKWRSRSRGLNAAAAIGADRFDREIKFAARLHHPNIVPLYDSGDEQGWLYYVMPVMRGGSLRQRLSSGKPLPIDAVQRILREIAAALRMRTNRTSSIAT